MKRRHQVLRNVVGSVAVVVCVLGLSVGLPAVDRALPVRNPVEAGRPLPVGEGVTVEPPPDTALDASGTSPRGGRVTLVVGGLSYVLTAEPFTGSLEDLAAQARADVTGRTGIQGVGVQRPAATDEGVDGLWAGFTTPDAFGWYEVYLHAGVGVTVVVEGNDRNIAANSDAVDASIATIRFGSTA